MKGKHWPIPAMVVPHRCYPLVYIAGPIASDHLWGARRAMELGFRMVKEDRAVPIITHAFYLGTIMGTQGMPATSEEWLHLDAEYIKRCDAVYRLSGTSPGADREVEFADSFGLPTFVETDPSLRLGLDDVRAWIDFCQWSSTWVEDEAECYR